MDDFFSFLILAGVLWSVIGTALGKKGKTHVPPPGNPPRPRPGTDGGPWARGERAGGTLADAGRDAVPAPGGSRAEEERSAAELVPDDLWAILTGEPRPRPQPPEPVPRPRGATGRSGGGGEADDASASEAAVGGAWSAEDEAERAGETVLVPASYEEARSLERQPPPSRPTVVSLESPPPPPEVRHRAFHRRLARLKADAAASGDGAAAGPRGLQRALAGRRELQRAIVLREVLGPPKGLE